MTEISRHVSLIDELAFATSRGLLDVDHARAAIAISVAKNAATTETDILIAIAISGSQDQCHGNCVMSGIIIEDFRSVVKNSLRGFARMRMPSGLIVLDVGVFKSGDCEWASPPSKQAIGRDGNAVLKLLQELFSQGVVAAIRASTNPEVFK